MTRPRYAITSVPQMAQQSPGPLGILGEFAKNKALGYGINAAFPQAGLAQEAALAVAPSLFNEGGKAESNWDKLMRQWAELKAASEESQIGERMETIGEALQTPQGQMQVQRALLPYQLNMGGMIPPGHHRMPQGHIMPDSAHYQEGGQIHIKKGNEGKFTAKAKAAGMGVQEYARKVLASDSASPATKKQANFARNAAKWHNTGGPITGMTPGPLGMSDMLAAGKGKDVSKVTYKKKGGKMEEQVDIAYHAPLAPKGDM